MKLTERQKEVLLGLRSGRKMTLTHYISDNERATWDDEPWTPYQKNWAVVVRALRKKHLVDIDSSEKKTFHVFSVVLTPEGAIEADFGAIEADWGNP